MSKGMQVVIECDDLKKLSKISKNFPNETRLAMVSALNRASTTVRALMAREANTHYSIKVGDVKKTITVKRATKSDLTAENTSKDQRMKLSAFPYTVQKKATVRTPVKVRVKRGEAKIPNVNPPMFFGAGELYRRHSKRNRALRLGMSISIPQMISNDEVYKRIQKEGNDMLEKRLIHELEFRTNMSFSDLI